MPQESPNRFKCWLFTFAIRGLLEIILMVMSNANGKTAKEISETTGIKPMYVELALELLSDTGIVKERDGRYYVNEEAGGPCELIIESVLQGLETSLSG
jgi:predicted transcriptional regulator